MDPNVFSDGRVMDSDLSLVKRGLKTFRYCIFWIIVSLALREVFSGQQLLGRLPNITSFSTSCDCGLLKPLKQKK